MLSFNALPAWLDALDDESRRAGTALDERLRTQARDVCLRGKADATRCDDPGFYFIISGTFKWCDNGHFVRMYSDGDWVKATPTGAGEGSHLESDFACDVRFYPRAAFLASLAADPAAQELWQCYQDAQARIMLGLVGVLSTEEVSPNFGLRSFERDDIIVTEGAASTEVYVMLEGRARVELGGQTIGAIGPNEVFGEIGFFTQQPRSATVIADRTCLVQIVEGKKFALLIRAKPDLLAHVTKTLALRIVDLNRRLSAQSTPPRK